MSHTLDRVIAVVLAGGLGTRLKSLYPHLPKPMIPVCGKPFLEWVIRYLRQQGLGRAIISSGYLAEVVAQHFDPQPLEGISVQCVNERSPQGTAGGFLEAVANGRQTPEAWLVLNGDSFVFANLALAAEALADKEIDGTVIGVAVPDTSRYGKMVFDQSGKLLHFEEKRPGRGVISAGMYFFKPDLLARFPRQRPLSFETDVFPSLLSRQVHLQVSVTTAPFLDIGTPESLALAEDFIRQNGLHLV